jgi:hypothetical protein
VARTVRHACSLDPAASGELPLDLRERSGDARIMNTGALSRPPGIAGPSLEACARSARSSSRSRTKAQQKRPRAATANDTAPCALAAVSHRSAGSSSGRVTDPLAQPVIGRDARCRGNRIWRPCWRAGTGCARSCGRARAREGRSSRVWRRNVDGLRRVEARQDLLDDPSRQSGGEQPSDLQDPVHMGLVVVAVPVGGAAGDDQPLLLVVAQKPSRRTGSLGQLPDTHGPPHTGPA